MQNNTQKRISHPKATKRKSYETQQASESVRRKIMKMYHRGYAIKPHFSPATAVQFKNLHVGPRHVRVRDADGKYVDRQQQHSLKTPMRPGSRPAEVVLRSDDDPSTKAPVTNDGKDVVNEGLHWVGDKVETTGAKTFKYGLHHYDPGAIVAGGAEFLVGMGISNLGNQEQNIHQQIGEDDNALAYDMTAVQAGGDLILNGLGDIPEVGIVAKLVGGFVWDPLMNNIHKFSMHPLDSVKHQMSSWGGALKKIKEWW